MTGGRDGEVVVFAGPSLPTSVRPQHPRLSWRPPVLAGDLLALLDDPPAVVAMIDGLFDASPAVRHKEVLALMARGAAVLGAASMGALRAAELAPFGMRGVGRIYAAFRSGRLWADDEVALLHGPQELDWPTLSEPLVNVRATLLAAARARVLTVDAARDVLALARATFYQERTWPALLAGAEPAAAAALRAWLPHGKVDLKRRDAQACVAAALEAAPGADLPEPPATLFTAELARQRAAEDERRRGAAGGEDAERQTGGRSAGGRP